MTLISVARQTLTCLYFPDVFVFNMPRVDAATRTRCVAILAALALHVLLLASLRSALPPQRVQSAAQERLLTVILAHAPNPQSLPPDAPKKSPHAHRFSQTASKVPETHQRIRPTTEVVERRADTVETVGEAPAETTASNADSSAGADSTSNVDLSRQQRNWTSNAGALDQRWLPRNPGASRYGAARPTLRARTNEDKAERAVSRSALADCRTRYADMGLLAIPFLLNDTASDKGCKW